MIESVLRETLKAHPRPLIIIDGPCGSGKSTLAARLSEAFPRLCLVHMDDFYVPIPEKTPERLSIPGGNANAERLWGEVLEPWLKGAPGIVRPYRAHTDSFLPSYTVSPDQGILLEGSYSGLPLIGSHADLKLFVWVDAALQRERILRRNGEEIARLFFERWIPLENAYFSHYRFPDASFVTVSGRDFSLSNPSPYPEKG